MVGEWMGGGAEQIYLVKVIHRGRERDYFDFWRRQREKNAAGETLDAALVGFEVRQSATSVEQAVAAVRRKHPGLQIDVDNVQSLPEG